MDTLLGITITGFFRVGVLGVRGLGVWGLGFIVNPRKLSLG